MSDVRLETAVLGLSEGGRLLLEAASRQEGLRVSAIAGKDANVAEKIAAEYGCQAYDDYRQLVIQNQLDCLLVAAPIHSCDEYVRTAMKRGSNVLKLAPPARNFEEAAELVRLAEHEKVQFAIANPLRFSPGFLAVREALAAGQIEGVFLIEAHCWIGEQPENPWQSDPKLAGGGVLLHECYDLIDQIMWNFPLAQNVYALTASQAHDKQQRLYLTEDTAVITMRFSDTLIANVVASRRREPGPTRRFIKLYGKDNTLTVEDDSVLVSGIDGGVRGKAVREEGGACCLDKALESFVLSVVSPEENKLQSGGRENLRNMAVVEAAYLSARTTMPEEPGRILRMAQLEADAV